MISKANKEILEDPSAVVKQATNESEAKLLNRDERKEMQALKEILLELTPFQIRFIEQYIRTGVAGQAARLAGSKSNQPETIGYKLLTEPKIQKALAIAMKKRIEAVGLDSVEVIMKLRRIYDEALEAGKFEAANKACELLQREIERASKAPGEATKVGKVAARLGAEEHQETQVVENEFDRVLSIVYKNPEAAKSVTADVTS